VKHALPPIPPPDDPELIDVWRIVEMGRLLSLRRRLGLPVSFPKEQQPPSAAGGK